MEKDWKVVFSGKIIEVLQKDVDINGKKVVFEKARRSPGTRLIIPVDDDRILITREFRHEHNNYDYRLPGGKVLNSLEEYRVVIDNGGEISELAKIAAIKEAKEETGIIVKDIELFYISKSGATVEWDLYYFVVKDFERGNKELEDDEDIEVLEMTKQEVKEKCLSGEIGEDRSVAQLLKFLS